MVVVMMMMMVMVRETATAAASALFSGDRETPDFEMHALSSKSIESFVSVCSCVFSARQLSAADCECSLCSHTHSTVCGHFSLSFFRSRCGHKKCEEWSTTFGWHYRTDQRRAKWDDNAPNRRQEAGSTTQRATFQLCPLTNKCIQQQKCWSPPPLVSRSFASLTLPQTDSWERSLMIEMSACLPACAFFRWPSGKRSLQWIERASSAYQLINRLAEVAAAATVDEKLNRQRCLQSVCHSELHMRGAQLQLHSPLFPPPPSLNGTNCCCWNTAVSLNEGKNNSVCNCPLCPLCNNGQLYEWLLLINIDSSVSSLLITTTQTAYTTITIIAKQSRR